MGRCWRCDTELRLEGNQWLCDNCNETIGYRCWDCGKEIIVRDCETKKKIPECNSCGYYYCPSCQSCAPNCPKKEWMKLIFNILAGQTNLNGELIINDPNKKVKKIVQLIETLKTEKREHMVCPYFVYASYARGKSGEQGRIKQLLSKMNGVGVKSSMDAEGFKKHFNKVLGIEEGETFTINDLRENGRNGQEERDACNLGICMGELKAKLTTTKKGKKAMIYEKISGEGRCKYLREDNFITKRCPKCHRDYNNPQLEYHNPNLEVCPICVYKKGKNKNQHPQLVIKKTNTFICNCPVKKFTVINRGDEDGGEEE